MNWTGGTRARATKSSSTTTRLQRQYFAKARAALQSFALPFSQNDPAVSQKRKRHVTPEFDVVVKKKMKPDEDASTEYTSPYFKSAAEDKGEEERGSKNEKSGKTRRQMLLESDDWVCTALSQPLVMMKRPSRLSVLRQDDNGDRGLGNEETFSPAEDRVEDSGGDLDDTGGEGGYNGVGGGREGVLDGGEYSGGIGSWDSDGDSGGGEFEHIPVGNGSGYTKLDGGGYVQIGGPSRRPPTPRPGSWGPPEVLRHKEPRGGSEDTMLFDLDIKERPMFHYNHITPTAPKSVEKCWQARQTTAGGGGYSSSPLAAYSRQQGQRIPSSRNGDSENLGESPVKGAEGSSSLPENSPSIVHAQLASDPFYPGESRPRPRPKSGYNSWKGPERGGLAVGRYYSEDEPDTVNYVPDRSMNSRGTPFTSSTSGSPCPGSKARCFPQTMGPSEDDLQWKRFVRGSSIRGEVEEARSLCSDIAGGVWGAHGDGNQASESKETEIRSFGDWRDLTKIPDGTGVPPNMHAADNGAGWAGFVAAPLDDNGWGSPMGPPKRVPGGGPPPASGILSSGKSTALDTEIPKGKSRLKTKLKRLDEININRQEDRSWEAFVYGGFTDESDMELTPSPEPLYTALRARRGFLGEAAASPNTAGLRGRESPDMMARSRIVGGQKGKQPCGKLGGLLHPEPEVALPPIASPVAPAPLGVGGSAPRRKNNRLNWLKRIPPNTPGERMERASGIENGEVENTTI